MHELLIPILILCFIVAIIWSLRTPDDNERMLSDIDVYVDNRLIIPEDTESHIDRELKNLGLIGHLIVFFKKSLIILMYLIPLILIYGILKILINS